MIVMEGFQRYNRQRMLVQMILTAKEYTTKVAILGLTKFFSVQLLLHTKLVHPAASFIKTEMVSISNRIIL